MEFALISCFSKQICTSFNYISKCSLFLPVMQLGTQAQAQAASLSGPTSGKVLDKGLITQHEASLRIYTCMENMCVGKMFPKIG